MQHPLLSQKASRFTESVIRGMSIEASSLVDSFSATAGPSPR
jgi:hypothetical protein